MFKEKCCGCIIIENNKVLLVHQQKGFWGFPKGHVEENETEVETAIREVKEETNLDVRINNTKTYTETYISDTGNEKEVVYFLASIIGGTMTPQESEVSTIKWVTFEEALKLIEYENRREMFKKVIKDI